MTTITEHSSPANYLSASLDFSSSATRQTTQPPPWIEQTYRGLMVTPQLTASLPLLAGVVGLGVIFLGGAAFHIHKAATNWRDGLVQQRARGSFRY